MKNSILSTVPTDLLYQALEQKRAAYSSTEFRYA